MKPLPGEIWTFDSGIAKHPKHHLCVNEDYRFLFLNTPRRPPFPSELIIRNADVPSLPATACGRSAISCSRLVKLDAVRFRARGPRRAGSASESAMRLLVDHLLGCRAISDEEREQALDGLGPFYTWAAA